MKSFSSILFALLLLPRILLAGSLEGARLLDWYYPSERAYRELYKAAQAGGSHSWLVERMKKNEPLPQASARELALDLIASPGTSAANREALKANFGPESAPVISGRPDKSEDIADLEQRFSSLNAKMNELELSVRTNNYNRQTFPSVSANLRSAAVNSGGSGIFDAGSRGYMLGGVGVTFNGQGDAGGFGFGLDVSISPRGEGADKEPISSERGTIITSFPSFEIGYKSATFALSFGGGAGLRRSALVLGLAAAPGPPSTFYVNQEIGNNRPPNTANDMKLGLPWSSDGRWTPTLIYLNKQGAEDYWPFTNTEFFYGPEQGFNQTYNSSKINLWGSYLALDTGTLWNLVDHQLVYGAVVGAANDRSQLRSYGLSDRPSGNLAWAVGAETLMTWAGKLEVEYGQSNRFVTNPDYLFVDKSGIEGAPSGILRGFERRYGGDAYVAAYTHPLGMVTLGLEYSHISPLFLPAMGAVNGMIVNGVDSDPVANTYSGGTITPWFKPPAPAGHMEKGRAIVDKTNDMSWGTNVSAATGMMTNSEKGVAQLQVAWAWISLGLFGGVASQIEASGPWLVTQPSLEAGKGGFMLWDRVGGGYWLPPLPLDPAPARTNAQGTANKDYSLWAFNRPVDGNTPVAGGPPGKVHWNAMTQFNYQSVDYYVLFSKNGVGDNRIDGFNQKYVNYAAGTLQLDLKSLFGRILPFELSMFGVTSDVSRNAGLPRFGEPGAAGSADMLYFNQSYVLAYGRFGVTQSFSLVGLLAHEEWKSNHSFFPIHTGLTEYGGGCDIDLNSILTGLSLFLRSRIMNFEDYNIGRRAFSMWESSLGTNLSF